MPPIVEINKPRKLFYQPFEWVKKYRQFSPIQKMCAHFFSANLISLFLRSEKTESVAQ